MLSCEVPSCYKQHFLIRDFVEKGEKFVWGSEKKGIFLLPDLLGKGYIFKALGQAWLTISSWEWTHWECR